MMSEPIQPALTAEEWKRALPKPENYESYVGETPAIRHYLAALNLVDQPFGFTREDVRLANEILNESYDGMDLAYWIGNENVAKLEGLRDRIDALLPPEA